MKRADFSEKVNRFCAENELLSTPCKAVVALSGGADSMTALHTLLHWPQPGITVTAAHVNHGLRGEEADRDEAFVRQICRQWQVPLTVVHLSVSDWANEHKIGTEEAGRILRYEALENIRRQLGADAIVTAHTASDLTETVLMNWVRGCGVNGFAGIPVKRGAVIRPLLGCTRDEIENYCRDNEIAFVTDSTNEDASYRRNFIRHRVIPLLKELNPSLEASALRTAKAAEQDEAFFKETACRLLDAQSDENAVLARVFQEQGPSVRLRMWRELYRRAGCRNPSESYLSAMDYVAMKGTGTVTLPDGYEMTAENGCVRIRKTVSREPYDMAVEGFPFVFRLPGWEEEFSLSVTDNGENEQKIHKLLAKYVIDYDKMRGSLQIRNRCAGESFHPAGRNVGKTLKDSLWEQKIPAAIRPFYPVVCDEEGIVLVPGIACDERVKPTEDTKHFLVWQGNPV